MATRALAEIKMLNQYSIDQAQNQLTSIIHEVEKGNSAEITRNGEGVAVLISAEEYHRLTTAKPSLWRALEKFRAAADLEAAQIEPEDFRAARDRSPGGEATW